MSVQAITKALALAGISPSEKLVLLVLANYADERLECWPSQVVLAADTCMTDRGVRKILAALEERGMVSRLERRRGDGYRAADLIRLNFDVSPERRSEEPRSAEQISPEPESILTGTGFPAVRHVKEPSEEPSPSGEGRRRATARKSSRCPPTFRPSLAAASIATDLGLSDADLAGELAQFRDHEFRSPRSDWDAAFRNWLRKASPRARGSPHWRDREDDARRVNAEAVRRIKESLQ